MPRPDPVLAAEPYEAAETYEAAEPVEPDAAAEPGMPWTVLDAEAGEGGRAQVQARLDELVRSDPHGAYPDVSEFWEGFGPNLFRCRICWSKTSRRCRIER
jgi:hypothetical protein